MTVGAPVSRRPRAVLVVPTLDEQDAIAVALSGVPRAWIDEIIVADSGSRDATAERSRAAGARVIDGGKGYGRACMAGALAAGDDCEIVVFMDGDGSDRAECIPQLITPLVDGSQDFVIASRTRGARESGSMGWHQILIGQVIGILIRIRYGVRYTDMCAFRAIRRATLLGLGMREMTYGWNLEMQMRVAQRGLRVLEIPVPYGLRVGGASKVAGNWRGIARASSRILATFLRIALEPRRVT